MSAVAVIPVRGGSKRIPRKNARPFRGFPLLAYAIEACHAAQAFDRVVVSTEDAELAGIARTHGAEVRDRPPALADDRTPLAPVALDALDALGADPDHLAVVLANPFVLGWDLRQGLALARVNEEPYAAVAWAPAPAERLLRVGPAGLAFLGGDVGAVRTQDLALPLYDAGQWYLTTPAALRATGQLLAGARPYVIPCRRVCDIDTEDDWSTALRMHRHLEIDGWD